MATYDKFLEKWNEAPNKRDFVRDRTPVIIDEDKQAEVMEFIYANVDDPWEYTEDIYKKFHAEFIDKIKEYIDCRTVWDLGAGIGSLWLNTPISDFPPGLVNCLEVSKTAVEKAQGLNNNPNINYVLSDVASPTIYEQFPAYIEKEDVVFTMSFIYLIKASRRREIMKKICESAPKFIISSATRRDTEEEIFVFPVLEQFRPDDIKYKLNDKFYLRNPHAGGLAYTTTVYERISE